MAQLDKNMGCMKLMPVDRIELTTLVDNYVDLILESTSVVRRPPLTLSNELPRDTLLAEHGLSLYVQTFDKEADVSVLFDTAYNEFSLLHNLDMLRMDISCIDAIVVSHAHMDHLGSLSNVVKRLGREIPLIVHPAAFEYPRVLTTKTGAQVSFPQTLNREELAAANIRFVESSEPSCIANGRIIVTGQVERTTDFEQGMPNVSVERNGRLERDQILDDQSLVLHLKDKGLVLITGCCHSGIINTVQYVRKCTGIEKIYGIFGGFHLTGSFFEPIIDKTIEALREINPEVIVPMHCTGWKAINKISEAFKEAFILNSVGSTFVLE